MAFTSEVPVVNAVSPASPGASTTPKVSGTATAGTSVQLYTDATCSTPIGPLATAAQFAAGIQVSVAPGSNTTFRATETDGTNVSACSPTSVPFVSHTPSFTSTSPASPGSSIAPKILGSALAGSTVQLYSDSGCMTPVGAATPAATFASSGIQAPVPAGTTVTFFATETDASSNTSGCSPGSISFTSHLPTVTGTTPASGNVSTTPKVVGTAIANTTVKLYTNSTCTSAVAASGTAAAFASPGLPVTVSSVKTSFFATETDGAGNVSGCSATSATYAHLPSFASVTPASNSSSSVSPTVSGAALAGTTVTLFTNATCTSAVAATGSAALFAAGLGVTVSAVNTSFFATETDTSGTSPCTSTSITYSHVPAVTAPVAASTSTTPAISGAALAGSTVKLYTNSSCTSAIAASGTAAAFTSPGLSVSIGAVSTTFFATETDAGAVTSICSPLSLTYAHLPSVSSVSPTSGSSLTPAVFGSAISGSTVRLFTNGTCTSTQAGSGTAAAFTTGITGTPALVSTTFFANETDATGTSPCSASSATYTHVPSVVAVSPASPNGSTLPSVRGTAVSGSTVKLYTNNTCTTLFANGTAATYSTGISGTISNVVTNFFATETDTSNATSGCSTTSVSYTHQPSIAGANPGSATSSTTTPSINGFALGAATVRLFPNSGCGGASAASGTGTAFASGLTVTISNVSTTYFLSESDSSGTSPCSPSGFTWLHVPSFGTVTPTSPANSTSPTVNGFALSGSTVRLYTNSTCTSAIAASGLASAFAAGLTAPISTVTTTFFATETDGVPVTSPCTPTSVFYQHIPVLSGVSPASPSNDSTPAITGSALANTTVKFFSNSACTNQVGAGSAASLNSSGIAVSVARGSTNNIFANETDSGNGVSPCSTTSIGYVCTPFAAPTITKTNPGWASGTTSPVNVFGTTEAGSTVSIYRAASFCSSNCCSGTPIATGTDTAFAAGIATTLGSTNYIYASATDANANVSPCSGAYYYTNSCSGAGVPGSACGSCSGGASGANAQAFGNGMIGCPGTVPFASRAGAASAICPGGTTVCSANQWVQRNGALNVPPAQVYWTNDALKVTNTFVSQTTGTDCIAAGEGPGSVCMPNQRTDALGNTCNLIGLGLETATPNYSFGGCNNQNTGGTLCCSACSTLATGVQPFDQFMTGCQGGVTFNNRASLCAPSCRACTAAEYVAHRGAIAPTGNYWTNDILNNSGGTTNSCNVFTGPTSTTCGAGSSMLVCSGTGGCNIFGCGLNTNTPNQFFGGCPTVLPGNEGTLCCCD